jgi:hypothetical protein
VSQREDVGSVYFFFWPPSSFVIALSGRASFSDLSKEVVVLKSLAQDKPEDLKTTTSLERSEKEALPDNAITKLLGGQKKK